MENPKDQPIVEKIDAVLAEYDEAIVARLALDHLLAEQGKEYDEDKVAEGGIIKVLVKRRYL